MPDGLNATSDAGVSSDAGADTGSTATPASPQADLSHLSPKERGLAALKSGLVKFGGRDAGDAGATATASPTTATAETEETDSDPVAAKVAAVAKRLEAKRQEAASKSEADQLDAKIAAAKLDPSMLGTERGREHLSAWCEATGVNPIALYDALTDWGEALASQANANPLETRLEKLERERQADEERRANRARAESQASAREAFLGTVTAESFPLLSALDPDEIMARGIAAATDLAKAGEDADAETIAALAEMDLRKLHSKIVAKGNGGSPAGRAEPRTLSGVLGGENPESPTFDTSEEGRRARGLAALERLGRG